MPRAFADRCGCWLVAALSLTFPHGAFAGQWYTLRNESPRVLIVQEVYRVQHHLRRGQPKRLHPGESLRDAWNGRKAKQLLLFDPSEPQQPLYRVSLSYPSSQPIYAIRLHLGELQIVEVKPGK